MNIFYDTECFKTFYCALFLIDDTWHTFVYNHDTNDRERLQQFILEHKKDTFIGFNSLKYDNYTINTWLQNPRASVKFLKESSDMIIETDRTKVKRVQIYNISDCRDVFALLGEMGSLKKHAVAEKFTSIVECPIDFNKETLTPEEEQSIMQYCKNDVEVTKHLYNLPKVQDEITARIKAGELYNIPRQNALAYKTGIISDIAIGKHAVPKKTFVTRNEYDVGSLIHKGIVFNHPILQELKDKVSKWHIKVDEELDLHETIHFGNMEVVLGRGGIHGATLPFVLKDSEYIILDADVKSYYPNIIVNLQLSPPQVEGYWEVLNKFLELRKTAKTKNESAAYKLIANAATGKLKSPYSPFYSPECNDAMTINGQLIVLELAEALHTEGIQVIQLNTDGLSMLIKKDDIAKAKSICDIWQAKWRFVLEYNEYTKGIYKDVNNYIAFKSDGTFKSKGGDFSPFDNKQVANRFGAVVKQVVNTLLGTDKAIELIDYVSATERKDWYLEGEINAGFNSHGHNRFYMSTVYKNRIGGIMKDGKRIKNRDNVGCANDLTQIADIDYAWYTVKAEEECATYRASQLPMYMPAITFHIEKKYAKKQQPEFVSFMVENKYIKPKAKRGNCPVCESVNTVARYDDRFYCFKCEKQLTDNDIKHD